MQVGTEILLARMKEYPDEFFGGGYDSRWGKLIDDARSYLPKEDIEALDAGYRQLQIDRFNERVLTRLAGEDKQEAEENTITYKASTGFFDPRALYGGPAQQPVPTYEEHMKQVQYEADQQRRAMNAAQGSQNNGIGISKWGGFF
jgi:hypothetical protein